MEAQTNPKSIEKSKVASHDLPLKPNELRSNVVGCRFMEDDDDEQDVKMKLVLQLPPNSAPTENRKATVNLDKAIEYELKHGRKLDPKMDRKKLRRTVSNRLSAQRSRVKKAQYIHDMERRVTELEDTITVLTLRVERFKEKRRLLQLQNEALERLVQIRLNEAHLAQLVLEKNKAELSRLKEVEKGLLKEIQMQGSSSSFYQEHQFLQKIDPFFNFQL